MTAICAVTISRVREVYGERTLAAEIDRLKDTHMQGRRLDVNDALAQIVHDWYALGGDADVHGLL